MDFKPEEKEDIPSANPNANSSNSINYFDHWIEERTSQVQHVMDKSKNHEEITWDIEIQDTEPNGVQFEQEIKDKMPPEKIKNLRVLLKRLPKWRDRSPMKVSSSSNLSSSRSIDKHGKYSAIINKRSHKNEQNTKIYVPETKSTNNISSRSPKIQNIARIDKEPPALTLPTQNTDINSRALLLTPAAFDSNSSDKLLPSDEDDIIYDLYEEYMAKKKILRDEAFRGEVSNNKLPLNELKKPKKKGNFKKKSSNPFRTKSVQTKFTCNDNICGIIDTKAFNLNCFYCYSIFPMKKWALFVKHVKQIHHLDENSQKMADMLLATKKIFSSDPKSANEKMQMENKAIDSKRMPLNIEKFTIPNLSPVIENLLQEKVIENDFSADETQSSKIEACRDDVLQNTNNKLSDNGIKKLNESSVKAKCYLISTKSNETAEDLNVADDKSKFIKLPSNIKIVKKRKRASANSETDQCSDDSKEISTKKKKSTRIYLVKKVKESKTSLNEDTAEEGDSSAASLEAPSHKSKTNCVNTVIEVIPKIVPLSKIEKHLTLPSPQYDCDTDDEMYSNDQDEHPSSTDNCDDTKETTQITINPERATPTSQNNKEEEASQSNCKTTIEAIPPKSVDSSEQTPFPARYIDSEDEMPSNDENEDEIPSSTNGCGILFGLTNRNIVFEFLNQLQKYPDLYKFNPNANSNTIDYNDSVRSLRQHVNDKFGIEMTDFEIRLSIQRLKYWYCHVLQKMKEHSRMPEPKKPFKHAFPQYFKIMNRFLTHDFSCTKDLVLGRRFQNEDVNELLRYPSWMVCKQSTGSFKSSNERDIPTADSQTNDLVFDEEDMLTDSDTEEQALPHSPFPPEPIICNICFEDFNSLIDLKRHRIGHFPPKYPCLTCKRMHYTHFMAAKCSHVDTPKGRTTEKVRKKTQIKTDKWICEICGACYKSLGFLNYHKKDKHYNMRYKCVICQFSCTTNYRLVQHQIQRHVVEYGTCEEILKRTRPRSRVDMKVPYTVEERKEYEWRREMRKQIKPGAFFYGCYKCKLVFETYKEKVNHNKAEHPIRPTTVWCLLCKHKNAMFSNSTSVRRHYIDVHQIPWNEIDNLMKYTKPLSQILTQDEISQLNTAGNHDHIISKILAEKSRSADDFYGDADLQITSYSNHTKSGHRSMMLVQHNGNGLYDDDSNDDDDLDQSTLYNDFEIDHEEYNKIPEYPEHDEYEEDDPAFDMEEEDFEEELYDEYQEGETDRSLYIEEHNSVSDYFVENGLAAVNSSGDNKPPLTYPADDFLEEQIIEEIVEDSFNDEYVMDDCY